MVMADRNPEDGMRNGLRSRGSSPNGSENSLADDSDHDKGGGMRVGSDFQAKIPEYNPNGKIESKDAMLVWAPLPNLSDAKIDEYVMIAKEKHGYNTEQALGMLFWHKHNIDKALSDLSNFTPFPDEWTVEDKVIFEQAFSFHGKHFHCIKQMLPDKCVSSLIKYYYSWKKTRSRMSLMDRQVKKLSNNKDELSEGSDDGSDSDSETKVLDKSEKEKGPKETCSNCSTVTFRIHNTTKGSFCSQCYQYWRRTGCIRSVITKKSDVQNRMKHITMKHKRKPPRGMHLTSEDLNSMAKGPAGQSDSTLKALDSELVSLKRQVQTNKQLISIQKHKTRNGLNDSRPPGLPQRIVSRWTNEELLLAVQGVRKYGQDFRAIAEVIGNKLEVHVRSFFVSYRRRYNLDEVLAEYELENNLVHEKREAIDDKMEIDNLDVPALSSADIPQAAVKIHHEPTAQRNSTHMRLLPLKHSPVSQQSSTTQPSS